MYDEDLKPDFLREGAGQIPENLIKFRHWFQAAVEHGERWRKEAKEDYSFVCGQQWTDDEVKTLEKQGRPAITINRIAPLINIVAGWQKLNRFDITFLGRTSDDVELAQVRTGVTKYVLDRCEYDAAESQAFIDMAIGGLGWLGVRYKFDYERNDGEAVVERVDPFAVYPDPEAHELDFSDMKFVCRAKWVDKDELKAVYADKAEIIEATFELYDKIENDSTKSPTEIDPSWYNSELKKVRVVECWYKVRENQTKAYLSDGQTVNIDLNDKANLQQLIMQGLLTDEGQIRRIPVTNVRCCTFFDKTLLEDIESPYQHGELPFVPCVFKYYGVGDVPAGFVRDLKNPQKELNKRRTQELHLLNSSGNGGGWVRQSAMTPEQQDEFKRKGNIPGHYQIVVDPDGIRERQPLNPPTAIINAENQAANDLTTISGINEQLLGTDIPNSASGRAIELRQKQAVTHLAVCFDSLRRAKKKIAYLLWGKQGKAGLIPQFYTAEKTYRIEGANGQEWVPVNQQVIQQDPTAGLVIKTLNDLSQGDFDMVVSDVEATVTAKQAKMYAWIDAQQKLGLPQDIAAEITLKQMDLPDKNEYIQKIQQRQQQQQQQAQQQMQMQLEIERIKNQNQNINIRDLPLPLQFAMAAQYGLIPQEVAQNFMQMWLQQTMPQLALQAQAQQQAMVNQQMQQQQLPLTPEMMFGQQQQNQAQPMTQAAAQSVMNGIAPAM